MKKTSKVFSLFLIPALLVGALPLTALPVSAATNVKKESALVNAVNKGNDVTLKADIEMENMLTIPEGVSITLDLNGYSLDRALDYEAQEDGSVILVEEGAELYIKDNSGTNAGLITGGASYFGGGICNYGTLTIQGGTITGNCAYDETDGTGGGVNNEGELTMLGGVITENEANYGGGLYNAGDGTVTIQQSTYLKKVGASSTEITMNAEFTANYAEDGKSHGIFNGGTLNIEGAPNISGNEDNDIYLAYGKKLNITGETEVDEPIGIQASGTNPVFTSGFRKYLGTDPSEYFKSTVDDVTLQMDISEARLRNDSMTAYTVYKNGTKKAGGQFYSLGDVWSYVTEYAQNDNGNTRVEVTLGSDYTFSENKSLEIGEGCYVVVDLNGHYIKRNPEYKSGNLGSVFKMGYNAKLTIKDSNPQANGYDGLKGGVIVNSCGNGVYLQGGGTFEMLGGTIYNCKGNYEYMSGGAVCAEYSSDNSDPMTLTMKDCSIRDCTTGTAYKGDGGAIYFKCKNENGSGGMTLENVDFRDNSTASNGGAIYLTGTPGKVRIKGCYFSGNSTGSNRSGGAIAVNDLDSAGSDAPTLDMMVEDSVFYKNSAEYGGVFSINKKNTVTENTNPVILKNCTMKNNTVTLTYDYRISGSALYICSETPVVIHGGEITNNSGGKGAVLLYGDYDNGEFVVKLSISGKLIVKDNKNADGNAAPGICRDNKHAMVYSAGLEEGSYIEIGSTDDSSSQPALVKNVSKLEKDYFHRVDGSLKFTKTGTETAQLATASIFGKGSWIAIAIMIAIALSGAAITVIIVKKKRKGNAERTAE